MKPRRELPRLCFSCMETYPSADMGPRPGECRLCYLTAPVLRSPGGGYTRPRKQKPLDYREVQWLLQRSADKGGREEWKPSRLDDFIEDWGWLIGAAVAGLSALVVLYLFGLW